MDEYIVKAQKNQFLAEQAEISLRYLNADLTCHIDVCALASSSTITTIFGEKRLTLEVTADKEMGGSDGCTLFGKSTASIQIKKSI